jgi:signal transduction histidine kinase
MAHTLRPPGAQVVLRRVDPGMGLGWRRSTRGWMTAEPARHRLAGMSHASRPIRALRARSEGSLARRLTAVALVAATVLAAHASPLTATGQPQAGYVALVGLVAGASLVWTLLAPQSRASLTCLVVLAGAGGLLAVASDDRDGLAAAMIFAAVATGAAAQAYPLGPAVAVATVATAALLTDVAHTPAALAFAGLVIPATLATGFARRQLAERAEVAEQLLVEVQRTREERARAAALDERMHVAREVHDVLAHSLTALAISLETAEVLLDERSDLAGGLERVRRARALAVDGLAETRGAVAALRGAPVPLPDSLERLLHDYRGDTDAQATLAITGDPRTLAAEPALALRRIAQEAVTNVRRHAPGAPVDAALHYDASTVRLSVSNAMTGRAPSPPSPGGGHGVPGMRERAEACGGRLMAGVVGGEWRVDVDVPA